MKKFWSKEVTLKSNALDLEEGVFTLSMLNFYINRAGKNLKPERREILEKAKIELRKLHKK